MGKPKNQGVNKLKPKRNRRVIAEQRVGKRCPNLRVLNSYWVNQDSSHKYFEVICVDPQHKTILKDPRINWICAPIHKARHYRGLTAAGKKSRGLQSKSYKTSHNRPSKSASWKRRNTLSLRRYR